MNATMDGERAAWLETIEEFLDAIEQRCAESGWAVDRRQASRAESKLGAYDVSVLMVRGPKGIVYVEAVARFVTAGDGLVDVYAWPSLRRMLLVRKGDAWQLRTDSGVPWPHARSAAAFREIVSALSAAA